MREYKEETNKQLAFPGLPVPEEKTLPGYMMILELTRQNQTQVSNDQLFSVFFRDTEGLESFFETTVRHLLT